MRDKNMKAVHFDTARDLWVEIFGETIASQILGKIDEEPLETEDEVEYNNSMNKTFNLYDATTSAIEHLVINKLSFTARQVARVVQNDNVGQDVPDDDVRGVVNTSFLSGGMGNYTRDLAPEINPLKVSYIYSPKVTPKAIKTSAPARLPKGVSKVSYMIGVNPNNPDKTTLRFRKDLVQSAGFKAGEKIAVFAFGSEVLIVKNGAQYDMMNSLNYKVGTKGDIRISVPTELLRGKKEEVTAYPHGEIFVTFSK